MLPGPVALAAPDVMTVLEPLPPGVVFVRALLAGWLVAAMVWLLHASRRASPFLVVWGCTALMPLLHLEHIVVGTVEATYAWWLGLREAGPLALHLGVALLGNTVGGVLLVAVINHARTRRVQSPNGHLTTWEMLSTFQAARASTSEPWSRKPTNPPD
ncbi:MAG: formate/nitrite transporter family protein [Alphaproteobacteria bacterium]|nr:formate/nitrite transporter family protein [Alphaproteobacteria bacterium]